MMLICHDVKAQKDFIISFSIADIKRQYLRVILNLKNFLFKKESHLNIQLQDFRVHVTQEKYDQPIVPADSLNRMLQFLPQLQNLNEELLKDLEERISTW